MCVMPYSHCKGTGPGPGPGPGAMGPEYRSMGPEMFKLVGERERNQEPLFLVALVQFLVPVLAMDNSCICRDELGNRNNNKCKRGHENNLILEKFLKVHFQKCTFEIISTSAFCRTIFYDTMILLVLSMKLHNYLTLIFTESI